MIKKFAMDGKKEQLDTEELLTKCQYRQWFFVKKSFRLHFPFQLPSHYFFRFQRVLQQCLSVFTAPSSYHLTIEKFLVKVASDLHADKSAICPWLSQPAKSITFFPRVFVFSFEERTLWLSFLLVHPSSLGSFISSHAWFTFLSVSKSVLDLLFFLAPLMVLSNFSTSNTTNPWQFWHLCIYLDLAGTFPLKV